MKKHLFFDMDGTLTPSRQPMGDDMINLMKRLAGKHEIVIVSGATADQMARQIPEGIFPAWRLSQNGNVAMSDKRCPLWRNDLTWYQKFTVLSLVNHMVVSPETDLVEDRGCQISYSIIGHHAPLDEKSDYDPLRSKRRKIINDNEAWFRLLKSQRIQYAIGGTTCIDFYTKTKGENVRRFLEAKQWKAKDCLYVGDALFEGGNDATVIGVVPTKKVVDSIGCERLIRGILGV